MRPAPDGGEGDDDSKINACPWFLAILPDLIVDERLGAYVERCTARPAFRRALDAQMGDFREAA